MKQIVPRYVDQLGARVLQMTFRAAEEETSRKTELRRQFSKFINGELYELRFIDMQIFHVHRVNRGEDIRRALNDALSGLR